MPRIRSRMLSAVAPASKSQCSLIHDNTFCIGLGACKGLVFLLTYECRIIGGELSNRAVKDEIGELRFASLAELGTWDLLPNVREALKYL
jgi:hypothetical protein